jgi:hypothetical protein
MTRFRIRCAVTTAVLAGLAVYTTVPPGGALLAGGESHEKLKAPGFRPQSKLADSFLEQLGSSRIAVLPTLIRTHQGTVHSEASQKAVVSFLKENKLGVPEMRETELDVGKPQGKGQYSLFMNDLKTIGKVVNKQSGAEYFVVLEHLVTPTPSGDIAIGGIHIYVLDDKGKNAFSFLLNSHHKIFVEAKLGSADSSKQGRDTLVLNGTKAALSALEQQIEAARGNK